MQWGAYTQHGRRDVLEAAHADLLQLYRGGMIVPPIQDELDLEGIPAGLAALEERAVLGRVVYVERSDR